MGQCLDKWPHCDEELEKLLKMVHQRLQCRKLELGGVKFRLEAQDVRLTRWVHVDLREEREMLDRKVRLQTLDTRPRPQPRGQLALPLPLQV